MKKIIKVYLDQEDLNKLKQKAGQGRGAISKYITKICREPVAFLDDNVRAVLGVLNFKPKYSEDFRA